MKKRLLNTLLSFALLCCSIGLHAQTITVTGAYSGFSTQYGTIPAAQSVSVDGSGLTADISVSSSNSKFLISTDNVSFSAGPITLARTGTTVASTPIYLKLAASAGAATFSGNVVFTSTGASTQTAPTGSITVTQKPLTVTAANVNKTYGVALSSGSKTTGFTSSGLVGTETIGSVTMTYGTGAAATDPAATNTGTAVPTAATGGTFNASNYTISYQNGDITVDKATLTITASAATRVYGSPLTGGPGSSAFTAGTTANGESVSSVTISYSAGNAAGSAVGTYTAAVNASAATGTINAANYNITYVPANLSVTQKPLVVTAKPVSKVYGVALSSGSNTTDFTSSGLVGSENIGSVTLTYGTGGAATDAAGTYTGTAVPSAATGGTFTPGNYSITYANGDITVTKASVLVTASTVNKPYGTVLTSGSVATGFTYPALPNGETIGSVTMTYGTGAAASDPAGTNTGTAVPSAATGGTFNPSNYTVSYAAGDIVVGKASLVITANSVSKFYGTVLTGGAGSTAFTTSGLAPGDNVSSVTITYTAGNTASSAVGPYPNSVVASAPTGSFNPANYTISYVNGTLNVQKAIVTVKADAASKVYGSVLTGAPGSTAFTATGLASGETIGSVTLAYNAGDNASAVVGPYTGAIVPSAATGGNFTSSNYTLNYTAGDLTVTPKPLVVTADPVSKTYGVALSSGSKTTGFTSSGLVGSETIGSVTLTYGTGGAAGDAVGTYTGTAVPSAATGGSFTASNYSITYVNGNITVGKANLIVTADNKSKQYGDALPAWTFTYSGFQNTDGPGSLTTQPTVATTATAASNVGNYTLTPQNASSPNYTFSYINGNLSVTPRPLQLTATGPSKAYGQALSASPSTNFVSTGEFGTEKVTSITAIPDAAGASASTPKGSTYKITPSAPTGVGGFLASNYTITPNDFTGTVGSRLLTIFAMAPNKTYDGTTSSGASFTDDRRTGDSFTINYTANFSDKNAGTGKAVSITGINLTGPDAANYSVTSSSTATADITPAVATVTAQTQTKVYDRTTVSTPTPVVTGLVGGDLVGTTPTQSFDSRNVGARILTPKGFVANDGTGGKNYTVNYVTASGTITPAPLSISAVTDTKTYDKTVTSTAVPTISGLIGSDTAPPLSEAFADANSGNGNKVLVPAHVVINDGNSGGNYTITYFNFTAGTISPLAVTVTAVPDNRPYNATTTSAMIPSVTSLITGDTFTGPVQTFDTKNVGNNKTLTPSGLVISDGNSGNNYAVSYVNSTSGQITQATVNVTAKTDTKQYDGLISSSVVPTVGALQGSEVIGTQPSQSFDTPFAGTGKTITPSGLVVADGNSGNNYLANYIADHTGIINKKVITVTAQHDERTYNGTVNSSVPPIVSGVLPADAIQTQPVQAFNTKDAGTGKTLSASGLVVANGSSYQINYNSDNTGKITPAAVTVVAQTDSKVYDKTNASAIAPVVTGILTPDTETGVATQTFNDEKVGINKTLTAAAIVINDGVGGADYSVTYTPASTGTITAKQVNITAQADSKMYDGTTSSSKVPVLDALVAGDVANASVQTFDTPLVGSGKTLTPTLPSINDGNGGNNYSVHQVVNTNGVIALATLTYKADTTSRQYGVANPTFTGTVTGFAPGDNLGNSTTGTATFTSTATANTPVGSAAITGMGLSSTKYTFVQAAENATALTIKKAALAITAATATKVYGDANPILVPVYTGFLAGDNAASLSSPPMLATTATATSVVGAYPITVSGATSPNYTITQTPGVLNITPKVLTITVVNAARLYGGADPVFSATYAGFVGSDNAGSLTHAVTFTNSASITSPVGNYTITPGGATSPNYTFAYANGTLTISAAPLTVTAVNTSKTYGSANPALTYNYTGFVNNETSATPGVVTTQPVISTTAALTSPAGSYPITAMGGVAPNYLISYVDGTLTVNPALLVVKPANATKVYGAANPVFSAGYTGFVNGENAGNLTQVPEITTSALQTSGVGTYNIVAAGAESPNYSISYVPGTLTVTKAGLLITANSVSKTYGTANPALKVTYTGFVGADNSPNLSSLPSVSTTAVTGSAAGTYPITASGAAAANYAISYAPGVLTIGQAQLTIAAVHANKTYGTVNPTLTVTYTGFAQGDSQSSLSSPPVISTTASISSPAGTYPITASGATSPNYSFNYLDETLVVNPAPLTITANNISKVYGADLPPLTVTYKGFIGTDNTANLSALPAVTTTAQTGSPVGIYPIKAGGAASTNYAITYVPGVMTVSQAPLVITADDKTRNFGDPNPTFTASYSGFLNGDNTSNLSAVPVLFSAATPASQPGSYTILAGSASAPNYSITYVNGTLNVLALKNANLSSLSISTGSLSPAFSAATSAYTSTVGNGVTSVTVSPALVDPNASIQVNGIPVPNGGTSAPIPLLVGANTITTKVTAQGGQGTNTYNVIITRVGANDANINNITVSTGTLSPAYNYGTTNYTETVNETTTSISITPTLDDKTASVKVNGVTVANGTASPPVSLNPGDNTITVTATAQDGTTSQTVNILVHRTLAPDAIAATNILTPNGDGKNDYWVVKDILLYPNNTVTVFDRAGRMVYTKHGYTNDWGGTLNGAPLAEDTYYYLIDLGPGLRKIKGFITVVRDR